MKISFKQFNDFIEAEDDLSDERLDEIFGLFRNNAKIEKLKAEKEALLAKRKAEQKKKDALFKDAKKRVEDEDAWNKERGSMTVRSQAASGRAAELDWVRGMTKEALEAKVKYEQFKPMNAHDFRTFQGASQPKFGKALVSYGEDDTAIVLAADDDKDLTVSVETMHGQENRKVFDNDEVGYARAHQYAGELRAKLNKK